MEASQLYRSLAQFRLEFSSFSQECLLFGLALVVFLQHSWQLFVANKCATSHGVVLVDVKLHLPQLHLARRHRLLTTVRMLQVSYYSSLSATSLSLSITDGFRVVFVGLAHHFAFFLDLLLSEVN